MADDRKEEIIAAAKELLESGVQFYLPGYQFGLQEGDSWWNPNDDIEVGDNETLESLREKLRSQGESSDQEGQPNQYEPVIKFFTHSYSDFDTFEGGIFVNNNNLYKQVNLDNYAKQIADKYLSLTADMKNKDIEFEVTRPVNTQLPDSLRDMVNNDFSDEKERMELSGAQKTLKSLLTYKAFHEYVEARDTTDESERPEPENVVKNTKKAKRLLTYS